jgi:hypothetical protein
LNSEAMKMMDNYEITEVKPPRSPKRGSGRGWNILTILVLVTMFCVLSYFVMIFLNPNSSLNPFPPSTLDPAFLPPTPTVTLRFQLVPTWTPTTDISPATNLIPNPTETPVPPITDNVVPTSEVLPGLALAQAEYAFEVQQGSPSALPAAKFHQDASCDWIGVAGQATSLNGEAVRGLFVQLGGYIEGVDRVDNLVMTGLASQYGYGGFEITIANKLIASQGTLWIQLLDQQNLPLSDRIYFDTYDDCQKNLIVIYFNQAK